MKRREGFKLLYLLLRRRTQVGLPEAKEARRMRKKRKKMMIIE